MSTLYLTEQGAIVTKTDGRLLIRKDGKTLHDLPAIHVEQIVIFGNVHFTPPAVKFILEQGIDVAYLSSYGTYRGRLQHALAKDATLRQAQYRKASDPSFCLALAKCMVAGKLQNTLAFTQRQRMRDTEVGASITLLRQLLRQLPTANTLDAVRGYEGAGSAAYYRAFRKFLKVNLGFHARIHHPPTDPVNVLLSQGYTLLFNHTFATINVVGLDPYLGFFHQTRHGHATLASDLMEEWRTIVVDSVVLRLLNHGELSGADFQTRDGRIRFRPGGMARFLHAYDARVRTEVHHPQVQQRLSYLRCIEWQVRHVAHMLTGQEPCYVPFRTR